MGGGDHCAVYGCNNDRRYPERYVLKPHVKTLRFYGCPKELRHKWTKLINRERFKVTSSTRVCSNHFKEGKKTVTNPLPTLYLKGLEKKAGKRREVVKHDLPSKSKKPKVESSNEYFVDDHSYACMQPCPDKSLDEHSYSSKHHASVQPCTSVSTSMSDESLDEHSYSSKHHASVQPCTSVSTSMSDESLDEHSYSSKHHASVQPCTSVSTSMSDESLDEHSYSSKHHASVQPCTSVSTSMSDESLDEHSYSSKHHASVQPCTSVSTSMSDESLDEHSYSSKHHASVQPCTSVSTSMSDESLDEHSYSSKHHASVQPCTSVSTSMSDESLDEKLKELVEKQQKEIEELNKKVKELQHFGIHQIKDSDKKMKLHTGLVNYGKFRWVFNEVKDNLSQLQYYKGQQSQSEKKYQTAGCKKPGPSRLLSPEDELLLTLMKIRMNLLEDDLALRFGISTSLVSRIISTWVPLLGKELAGLVYWPPSEAIEQYIPECFKKWPRIRAILDCTEIPVQRPSLAKANSQIYSNYKSRPTAKTLVACTPGGTVSFVSASAGGSMSDKRLVERSSIIDKFAVGDVCMADRGFNIQDLLAVKGVQLVIPPFLRKGKPQLSVKDNIKTKHVASARIHIERVIGRMKEFRILSSEYPLDMLDILDNVLIICAALVNLQPPLVPLK
ncbi:PREDICTED: uncharacterized protein LOC109474043 [Branchiostoma belcheri]|uniref:Uncharacterized protein LOC109474043 n=1 Tax=Branchiostoma belcheri TaxID=7741 RepID=A0A6P4ZFF0_BRABE|nr:PREDICTED: uncharacterized protein LOC109474043 [Branchiostoma belcheri]